MQAEYTREWAKAMNELDGVSVSWGDGDMGPQIDIAAQIVDFQKLRSIWPDLPYTDMEQCHG